MVYQCIFTQGSRKQVGTYIVLGTRRWEVENERAKDTDDRVNDDNVVGPSPGSMDQK